MARTLAAFGRLDDALRYARAAIRDFESIGAGRELDTAAALVARLESHVEPQ